MSRYSIVTQTYPADYWREYGEEIVGTANEMHDDRWSFRESRRLLATGLQTRSLDATGGSVRQVWISGLTMALLLIVLEIASGTLLGLVRFGSNGDVLFLTVILGIFGYRSVVNSERWLTSPPVLLTLVAILLAVQWSVSIFGVGLLVPALFATSALVVRFDGRLAAAASIYGILRAISILSFTDTSESELLATEAIIAAGAIIAVAVALGVATTHCTRQLARS